MDSMSLAWVDPVIDLHIGQGTSCPDLMTLGVVARDGRGCHHVATDGRVA
jgi:hypothetical protein